MITDTLIAMYLGGVISSALYCVLLSVQRAEFEPFTLRTLVQDFVFVFAWPIVLPVVVGLLLADTFIRR